MGEVTLSGQFVHGSNYTFLATAELDGNQLEVVYKPVKGEQPLWDFPTRTLGRREAAAWLVSEALGWRLVPPTVFRRKMLLGPGSLQQFIDHDVNYHYFLFSDSDKRRLPPVVVFDLLVNNADRKGSHVFMDRDGNLWSIDHGICFHVEPKLRTVIWDFAGEKIPSSLLDDLQVLAFKLDPGTELEVGLRKLLRKTEVAALKRRARQLVETGVFPHPNQDRRYFPWPPV